ncbi:hypothetical protein QE406_001230 [Microbacterium testaceum]|nr:hypothetical protein [Microbacterium sp. SORGH_AS_0969]MDQ1115221.1 hypothetical protein [Microbacterium testaceum]
MGTSRAARSVGRFHVKHPEAPNWLAVCSAVRLPQSRSRIDHPSKQSPVSCFKTPTPRAFFTLGARRSRPGGQRRDLDETAVDSPRLFPLRCPVAPHQIGPARYSLFFILTRAARRRPQHVSRETPLARDTMSRWEQRPGRFSPRTRANRRFSTTPTRDRATIGGSQPLSSRPALDGRLSCPMRTPHAAVRSRLIRKHCHARGVVVRWLVRKSRVPADGPNAGNDADAALASSSRGVHPSELGLSGCRPDLAFTRRHIPPVVVYEPRASRYAGSGLTAGCVHPHSMLTPKREVPSADSCGRQSGLDTEQAPRATHHG